MSRWLLVVLFACASLLAIPAGSAQLDPFYHFSIRAVAEPYPDPIQPMRETVQVPIEIDVRCGPFSLAPIEPVPVQLSVRADVPWAVSTISPSSTFVQMPPDACLQGYQERISASVEIGFTKDAPAFARAAFRLVAEMPYAEGAVVDWQQLADQYFHTTARFDRSIVHASANEQVQLPVTIENHGNGAVQVRFQQADETSRGLVLALPGPVIVPGFDGSLTVPIDVNTPFGFEGSRRDALVVDVLPVSADHRARVDAPLQIAAVVVTEGDGASSGISAEELPVFGLVPPLLLGLTALAAMRRRE